MPSDLMVRLESKIAACEADIERTARDAHANIERLKAQKARLLKAKEGLSPGVEVIVKCLKDCEVL